MSTTPKHRQMIVAGLFALGAVGAGLCTGASAQHVAAPGTCVISQTSSSSRVVCSPGVSPGVTGAPSQEDITAKNAYRARYGGLF